MILSDAEVGIIIGIGCMTLAIVCMALLWTINEIEYLRETKKEKK